MTLAVLCAQRVLRVHLFQRPCSSFGVVYKSSFRVQQKLTVTCMRGLACVLGGFAVVTLLCKCCTSSTECETI